MLFRDIIGQQAIKQHLVEMHAEERVPHAMLLTGQEGAGTLALAVAFAQYLNCHNRTSEGDSCGVCQSCRQYAKLQHPDLHFVYPIISADTSDNSETYLPQWREMFAQSIYFSLPQWLDSFGGKKQGIIGKDDAVAIHKKLSMNTFEGGTQVMIIWRPEIMNDTASNRLLKILEEPPRNTMFILVSESTAEILPTILSRTQVMKVPPIDAGDLAAFLQQKHYLSAEQAQRTAHIACGNYVRARQMIENAADQKQNLDFFVMLMRTCYAGDMLQMMKISDSARDAGREQLKARLGYSINLIRQCFVMNLGNADIVYMTPEEEAFAQKFAIFVHLGNAMGITAALGKAMAHIEQNGNARIILLDLMMQIAVLLRRTRPAAETN